MALPKIQEVRELSDEELSSEIVATKKKLFDLRFQQATRRLETPHQFKHMRHRLAQLLTIERERELAIESSVPTQEEE
ncbi:50S ribosomal protein L29 [Aphanothece sacrum]|uniref:Large ribosomal subunit protein uL29 n=1 Tax=Aphanothece sacrum FPU1 TaxID=1920663 RepID=A0A401IFB1_APHSA|nr:50S ribosomal protein L29 [Aphanothece sacrum]GBF79906.1 50S ribosomal protein L29 [Aphanothece sacrum FPU1]GBF83874.1 50S ribosomal protein L29 [Aphanothece sacrum FPU3]